MSPRTIVWDGEHVPEAMKAMPPGRYVLQPADDDATLTQQEESGIREALDQIDAGQGRSLREVIEDIRRARG